MKKVLMFLLMLLVLASCGKKEVDQNAVENTETQAQTTSEQDQNAVTQEIREVDLGLLQQQNNTWYITGEQEPFTGVATKNFQSGELASVFNFKNGKYHGEQIYYNKNGQVKSSSNYINGVQQ